MTGRRTPSLLVMLASVVGALTIFYPFLLPILGQQERLARRGIEVPLLFALLSGICLLTILVQIQRSTSGPSASESKLVALLGVLVATDAALTADSQRARGITDLPADHPDWLCLRRRLRLLDGRADAPGFGLHYRRHRSVAPLSDADRRLDRPDRGTTAAFRVATRTGSARHSSAPSGASSSARS